MSQVGTCNKDKDGNKQVLDKIWQSISPGRCREAEGRRQGERQLDKSKYQAKGFRVGPTGDRTLDETMITWFLRRTSPWMLCRMNDKGRKDRG